MNTGDVSDFGDLTSDRGGMGSVSNGTRGVFGSNAASNVLDYITIATTGDATDFGDSSDGRGHAACSGD